MIALLNSTDILSSSFLSRPDGSDGWLISVEVELASFTTYNKVGATYENPLKSSWAVALGGIPGESEIAVMLKCTLLPRGNLSFVREPEFHLLYTCYLLEFSM